MTDESRQPQPTPNRGDRIQLVAILAATLLIMIAGAAVVAFPQQFGLPGRAPATPVIGTGATPVASPQSGSNR